MYIFKFKVTYMESKLVHVKLKKSILLLFINVRTVFSEQNQLFLALCTKPVIYRYMLNNKEKQKKHKDRVCLFMEAVTTRAHIFFPALDSRKDLRKPLKSKGLTRTNKKSYYMNFKLII